MRSSYLAQTDRFHKKSFGIKRVQGDLESGLRRDNAHARYTNVMPKENYADYGNGTYDLYITQWY